MRINHHEDDLENHDLGRRTVDEGEIPEETAGPYPADGSN